MSRRFGIYFSIGTALLSALFGCYVLGMASILCFRHVGQWVFPCSLLLGGVISWILSEDSPIRKIDALAGALLIVALSLLVTSSLIDFGYDGILYHQQMTAELADGWDMLRNPHDITHSSSDVWVTCYAKGMELTGATVCATFGGVSVMRTPNLMLIFASAFLLYDFLCRLAPQSSRVLRVAVTIAVIGNTVGVSQCLSTYNDYPLYYYILLTIIFSCYASKCPKTFTRVASYLFIGGITVLAIATKFNAFFYQGVAIFFIILWQLFHRRYKQAIWLALTGICALIIGVILAWNPYVINTLEYGNSLYPLFGEGSVDIMAWNTPDYYTNNRFLNFAISLFRFGVPYVDNRCGMFGPTFPIMLAISAGVFIAWRKRLNPVYAYAAVCALLSVFFIRDTWWVRYFPQFYISGVAATVALLPFAAGFRRMRICLICILACAYINIGIAAAAVGKQMMLKMKQVHFIEKEYKGREVRVARDLPHFHRYLLELGITPVSADEDEIEKGVSIRMFFPDNHCAVILATPEESRRFVEYGRTRNIDFQQYLAE